MQPFVGQDTVSILFFLILVIITRTRGEGFTVVNWDDCSFERFREELYRSCKYKRDESNNSNGGPLRIPGDHHEGNQREFEEMDFYKEIHATRPRHPLVQRPEDIPRLRQHRVSFQPLYPSLPLPPQQLPYPPPPMGTPYSYYQYQLPEDAFEEGGKTRKRMLRNAYMSLVTRCCGKSCKSEEFRKYCPT